MAVCSCLIRRRRPLRKPTTGVAAGTACEAFTGLKSFHAAITQEEQEAWDAQLSAAREKAAQSDLVKQVETWFGDGAEDGEKAARELVETWKSEYRAMV